MTDQTNDVLDRALQLTPVERAELIDSLWRSFELSGKSGEFDELWAEEAEARIDAYKAGKLSSKSADEVFANINKDSTDAG